MTKTLLYSVFALALVTTPARALAQAAPATPAPGNQSQPANEPVAPVIAIIGEEYHVELQVNGFLSVPSTVLYSDTETTTATVNGTSTSTVVNGTLVDFKTLLNLKNQVFPEGRLTIRLVPKHKLRGEYVPMHFKQSIASLGSDFKFNGQTYTKGTAVDSTMRWNEWYFAYEFDPIVTERAYVGAMAAVSSLNISAATADATQNGTASVNIMMPGLGATGRFYVSENVSVSGDFLYFYLPGSDTSTHGHIMNTNFYLTYNINKHLGAQVGYKFYDTTHVWSSPLNTGSMTIGGPFVGGTAHF